MQMKRINFTKAALDKLNVPAQDGRLTLRDAKVNGLQIRVTSSGVKTFSVFRWVRSTGRPERVTLGRYPDMSIEKARKKAEQVNGQIADGTSPVRERAKLNVELTLGGAFQEYLDRHVAEHCRPRRYKDSRADFERYLGKLSPAPRRKHGKERKKAPGSVDWDNRKLSSISTHDVTALQSALAKGCGKRTANIAVTLLSTIYNKAIEWRRYAGPNPVVGVKKYRTRSRDRFVQPDEMPALLRAIYSETNDQCRDYLLLSLLTGARRSNLLEMKWEHVNLSSATWYLPDTKNAESQTIPLVPQAVEILQRRKTGTAKDETYVFPGRRGAAHMKDPKKAWTRVLTRAGVKDLRLHDLRRTLGSWQAATGASLVVIGKTLNHKSAAATQVYARLNLDPVRKSMETATRAMFAAPDASNNTKDGGTEVGQRGATAPTTRAA